MVYEQTLGDDKYTFVEDVESPFSCTIVVKVRENLDRMIARLSNFSLLCLERGESELRLDHHPCQSRKLELTILLCRSFVLCFSRDRTSTPLCR